MPKRKPPVGITTEEADRQAELATLGYPVGFSEKNARRCLEADLPLAYKLPEQRRRVLDAFLRIKPEPRRHIPSIGAVADKLGLDVGGVEVDFAFLRGIGALALQASMVEGVEDPESPPAPTEAETRLTARAMVVAEHDWGKTLFDITTDELKALSPILKALGRYAPRVCAWCRVPMFDERFPHDPLGFGKGKTCSDRCRKAQNRAERAKKPSQLRPKRDRLST